MTSAIESLKSGGPIVWILLVLSVVSWALIVLKIVQLRRALSGDTARSNALETWSSGDRTAAMRALETGAAPADRMTLNAMKGIAAGRHIANLTADLEWRGNREVSQMQTHIRLLELVAMISPLLGLLGTVLGMIQSFQELALAEGAANASLLAGGIWQALLTTAVGLGVAIPAAVAATLLGERVERAAQSIEAAVGQLFAIEAERH
jgi:biopolymer transport protein ExbB